MTKVSYFCTEYVTVQEWYPQPNKVPTGNPFVPSLRLSQPTGGAVQLGDSCKIMMDYSSTVA